MNNNNNNSVMNPMDPRNMTENASKTINSKSL